MLKLNSKGQGAMEYLMNYSWAILVVVTVGLVLWQLGVFNQGQGTVIIQGFPQIKPMAQTVLYTQAGAFQASMLNTLGTAIFVTEATMQETMASEDCAPVTVNGLDISTNNVTVSAGSAMTVASVGCPLKQKDEGYSVFFNITYLVTMGESGETVPHNEQGYINGKAE